ncbi:MAG: hypothetical protein HN617_11685 [Planctomycetaceae bacterium]|jgi:hypothetical protein|nr:hypothetical protein [Planctomycetaceae bacterium]MBT4013280.1 hypothetical protein [Planctomycetaceae bacterium]MBT4846502.1 hypothetical protein [Planctomycetaceae bacterium]MBT5123438.1 hypothetical protein [Planctomycetaceae bacterium]MBT5600171.1 hypothetical protein [Planctomycetaceae bacterium]
MNSSEQNRTQTQDKGSGGITGDIRSVKNNGAASLTELREFIGSLKGRKPQEAIEIASSNGLIRGLMISTIGFLVVLFVFTVIPFFLHEDEVVTQQGITPTSENALETQESNSTADAGTQGGSDSLQTPTAQGEELLDKLQIGETKTADPDANPLDSQFNDLLDGIE